MNKGVKYEPILTTMVSSLKEIPMFANPETGENEHFVFSYSVIKSYLFGCHSLFCQNPSVPLPTPSHSLTLFWSPSGPWKPDHLLNLSKDPWALWQRNWGEIIICFYVRLWTRFWDVTDLRFTQGPAFDFSRLADCNILFGSLPFPYAQVLFQVNNRIPLALIMRFSFLNLPW